MAKKKSKKSTVPWRVRARAKISRGFDWSSDNVPSYAIGVSLIFVVVTPILSFMASRAKGGWVWTILVVQVFVAAGAWLIPFLQRRRANRDLIAIEAQARVRVSDSLDPLFEELGALMTASPARRGEQYGKVLTMVLSSADRLIGPERSRACFFEAKNVPLAQISTLAGTFAPAQQRMTLQHVQSSGRSATGRSFMPTSKVGQTMIEKMRSGETVHCADVTDEPPEWWDATFKPSGSYETFISVPVKVKSRTLLGMLTLDNPTARSLDKDDVEFLKLLGRVLAVAISASLAGNQP